MEFPELAKLAFVRVQKVEPDNVGKIVGCILLREPDEEEMVQLAYGPDAALLARIDDAKATLAAIYARCSAQHLHHQAAHAGYHQLCAHPPLPRHFSSPAAALGFHVQSHSQHYWQQQHHDNNSTPPPPADVLKQPPPPPPPTHQFAPQALLDEAQYALHGQHDDHLDAGYYYAASDDAYHNGNGGGGGGALPPRAANGRRPSSNGLSSRRPCHYFFKGMCKNGQNCHYSHHQAAYPDGGLGFHGAGDEYGGGGVTPGSLETLELEITELLHSRRGQPVSIASLPTLYGEKYGKGLQAEGYLTESQRHGKAGYSLTKLLSRLNKIRVIESRPHGQHSVVLAEDAARYMEFRGGAGERGGAGDVPASSHQIYLTFPAESTFTEDDVADYFGQFGSVRDVRIPCQERRMFGFVSFQSPETVTNILTRRNPHFICGSRVLVKPYREKSKCIDSQRSHEDNVKPMVQYCPPRFFEIDPQVYSEYDVSRLMRKQLAEKRERLIELERRHIAGLKIDSLPSQFAYFDCSIEDATPFHSLPSDSKELSMMDPPLVSPDRLDAVSTSQGPPTQQAANNYEDQESNQIELLPESPFASAAPAGNGVSAII